MQMILDDDSKIMFIAPYFFFYFTSFFTKLETIFIFYVGGKTMFHSAVQIWIPNYVCTYIIFLFRVHKRGLRRQGGLLL